MKKRNEQMSATGMNLNAALTLARQLGFRIRPIRHSGDVLVYHAYFPAPLRISINRRDCPRSLSGRINKMLRFHQN